MILIVGCGFLGNYLLKEISKKTNESVVATIRNSKNSFYVSSAEYIYCDVSNNKDIEKLIEKCRSKDLTVFYLASCHDVDYVFENPEKAREINVQALDNFIKNVPNIKRLFYASTDCVYGEGKDFDGRFKEGDPLNPINEYGRQKIEAENIVISNGYNVLRFPYMFGPSLSTKKHFYDKLYFALLNDGEIELIDGMKRSAISYWQAAKIICDLFALEKLPQVINVCGDDSVSKYDIGCVLALKNSVSLNRVKRISEKDGKKFFKDKRATCIEMDNSLLKSLLNIEKIKWEEDQC